MKSTHKVTTFRRSGRRTGYYPNDIPADESHILEHVRNQVARQIVLFILENDLCTFDSILKNIKKAPSTLSWHLKRLSEAEIISVIYRQKLQLYRIVNSKLVSGMFSLPINEQPMRIMPMERKLRDTFQIVMDDKFYYEPCESSSQSRNVGPAITVALPIILFEVAPERGVWMKTYGCGLMRILVV